MVSIQGDMVSSQENTADIRQDDVRQALAQVEERATALREETDRLQDFGQNLAEQLRAEVAKTVQDGMSSLMAAAAATSDATLWLTPLTCGRRGSLMMAARMPRGSLERVNPP